jgi:hypothetical protein
MLLGDDMTTFTSDDIYTAIEAWRLEIINHMLELDRFIPVPSMAFDLVKLAKPSDYDVMSETEIVDLIIQEAQIRSQI